VADVQVTCITKPHPQSPHEHITHVGNPSAGWNWPREQVVVASRRRQTPSLCATQKSGKRADIGVVRAAGHAAFLRTHADGYWSDNLLALNQCPL
jgi:hypothetical protein